MYIQTFELHIYDKASCNYKKSTQFIYLIIIFF